MPLATQLVWYLFEEDGTQLLADGVSFQVADTQAREITRRPTHRGLIHVRTRLGDRVTDPQSTQQVFTVYTYINGRRLFGGRVQARVLL